MKNIYKPILVGTKEKSHLTLLNDGKLIYTELGVYSPDNRSFNSYQQLYIVLDKRIPYNANGGTNGLFICLSELEYLDGAIVRNVGNCGSCREIIASSNRELEIESSLTAYYRNGIGGATYAKVISHEFMNYFVNEFNSGNDLDQESIEKEVFKLKPELSIDEKVWSDEDVREFIKNSYSYGYMDRDKDIGFGSNLPYALEQLNK